MADVHKAWVDAGDALSGLGLKLKLHYEVQRSEPPGAVESAVARLGAAVQDVFDAMGEAAQDEAVRADVERVGQSLTDALSATFGEVSVEVRRAFDRKGDA
jgi:hypothetical protein